MTDQTKPLIEPLTTAMYDEMFAQVVQRIERFGESWKMAFGVVLFNYGSARTIAHCISGDWSGPKSEMGKTSRGLPACPTCGNVATEDADRWQLALVKGLI